MVSVTTASVTVIIYGVVRLVTFRFALPRQTAADMACAERVNVIVVSDGRVRTVVSRHRLNAFTVR